LRSVSNRFRPNFEDQETLRLAVTSRFALRDVGGAAVFLYHMLVRQVCESRTDGAGYCQIVPSLVEWSCDHRAGQMGYRSLASAQFSWPLRRLWAEGAISVVPSLPPRRNRLISPSVVREGRRTHPLLDSSASACRWIGTQHAAVSIQPAARLRRTDRRHSQFQQHRTPANSGRRPMTGTPADG
jgi:hypothetical protein